MKKPKADALPEILKALLDDTDVEYVIVKIKPKKSRQGGERTEAPKRKG
jgi:predicted metal-dependent hydrolase